jgi:ABC-type lipoprotein release transport system permease subunit
LSLDLTFTRAGDAPGIPLVVVSHGFWKNQLGADPSIVERAIRLGDSTFTAVVVLVSAASAAVFVPARHAARVNPAQLLKQA